MASDWDSIAEEKELPQSNAAHPILAAKQSIAVSISG